MFVAALYFPGTQGVIRLREASVPQLLNDRLTKKEYRDVYLDLNGAATAKTFIEDPGADGLKAKRESNQPFDQAEMAGKRTMFDGDWKAQKLSEQDYLKACSAADDRYAQILAALLAQVKKILGPGDDQRRPLQSRPRVLAHPRHRDPESERTPQIPTRHRPAYAGLTRHRDERRKRNPVHARSRIKPRSHGALPPINLQSGN